MSTADASLSATFAALGDPTRLRLLERLRDGTPRAITELSVGASMSRQGLTKHLRVLEQAGLVEGARAGRKTCYALRPEALADARDWLGEIGAQWEDALARLKTHVEREEND